MLVDKIASNLSLSPAYIAVVARTASHRYKSYLVKKKTGGYRTINHPARELKLLQRWLVENSLSSLPVHKSATAYKKGASIYRNAALHRARNFILKVDFADFFPSIRGTDVVRLLRANQDRMAGTVVGSSDIDLVRRLVCRDDRLTIGAPSSPLLSNLIMFEFDEKWSAICRESGITYSRYADDLYFSTNVPNLLEVVLADLRRDLARRKSPGLRINEDKTVFTSRKRRRMITGLVLTPTGEISLGRHRKRFIKSLVFRNSRNALKAEEIASLYGTLSYAKSVDPSFIETLRRKYGHAAIGEP